MALAGVTTTNGAQELPEDSLSEDFESPPTHRTDVPLASGESRRRGVSKMQLVGGVVGNVLEWYDFAVFGYLAEQLAYNFFRGSKFVRLLWVYGMFACAFFARPFGGTVFGKIGDKHGRKFAIQLAMGTMFLSTFLMGCLPTYSHVNALAPFLLLVLRVTQGFSAGGQLVGSFLLFLETASSGRRGLVSATVLASSSLGATFGAATIATVEAAFSPHSMDAFAWRIPFLLSGVLGVFAMIPQWLMADSHEFQVSKSRNELLENPLSTAFSLYRKEIAVIVAVISPAAGTYYAMFVWLPNFIQENGYKHALALVPPLSIFTGVLRLFGGHLADVYHWFPVLRATTFCYPFLAVPFYWFAGHFKEHWTGFAVPFLMSAPLMSMFAGSEELFMNDIVDAVAVRFSVMGVGYNASLSLFGGTAPLVAESLARFGTVWVGVYVSLLSWLSFFTLTFVVAPMIASKRLQSEGHAAIDAVIDSDNELSNTASQKDVRQSVTDL